MSGRANDEAPHDERDVDRRGALRLVTAGALAAIAGAAAATGATSPAQAGVGTMQFGTTNNAGSDGTALVSSAAGRTMSVTNSAPNGYAYGGEAETVYGGHGSFFGLDLTSGGTGARVRGVFNGVTALAQNPSGNGAVGIIGSGLASGTGSGVGGLLEGSTYGAQVRGVKASLLLVPGPLAANVDRDAGELVCEAVSGGGSNLWCTVTSGATPVLRKLAGPGTAGQLHVIDPVRVYDSRLDASNGRGPMTSGSSRLVSVANGIDLTTGVVSLTDVVPAGATAIAYNLTVVDTGGSGFLAVTAGSSTTFRASSINWSASGQILANGQLAPLDGERRVRIFAGGGGTAHVLVDVQGYYR